MLLSIASQGRSYFVDHSTETTHWEAPAPVSQADATVTEAPAPVANKPAKSRFIRKRRKHLGVGDMVKVSKKSPGSLAKKHARLATVTEPFVGRIISMQVGGESGRKGAMCGGICGK